MDAFRESVGLWNDYLDMPYPCFSVADNLKFFT